MFYSELGGVERAVMDLVNRLKEEFEVDVLCTKHGRGVLVETIDGVAVTRAGSPFDIAGRPLSRSFLHHLSGTKSDIIHYHLPCPLATAAHISNRPPVKVAVATWHHGLQRYPVINDVQLIMLSVLFKDLDAILVTSPVMLDSVPILSQHRDKCRVIPLGVDETRFLSNGTNYDEAIAALRRTYGMPMVLFVGRLVYYKGLDILINAMRTIDASLVIVGVGPLEAKLKNLADKFGMSRKVHFLGHVPDPELANLYRASSVYVLPSTKPTECFGLGQAEAMLSGLPVVNTSLPTGVPWVSQDQITGLTVPPGDERALSDAIIRILSDDQLRVRLGQAARTRALEHFTLRSHALATRKLYLELLERKEG
jgi:rhamnosyl/mannosyltransferase